MALRRSESPGLGLRDDASASAISSDAQEGDSSDESVDPDDSVASATAAFGAEPASAFTRFQFLGITHIFVFNFC